MRQLYFWIIATSLIVAMSNSYADRKHVRVVLDTSLSLVKGDKSQGLMTGTDPNGLAKLATVLLYDLTRIGTTSADSFKVIPFYPNWPGQAGYSSVQNLVSPKKIITGSLGNRDESFITAITAQPYNAQMTYFYPGLKAAIEDIKNAPGGQYANRVIVLVTDGLPEFWARDDESQHIKADLVPLLEAYNIRLYILGFAATNSRYFTDILQTSSGQSLGEVFADDRNGTKIIENIAKIFAHNFGYDMLPTPPHPIPPSTPHLNLGGAKGTDRAAVVVYASRNKRPPSLDLAHPTSGAAVDSKKRFTAFTEPVLPHATGASYSMQWVQNPAAENAGLYPFATDTSSGHVAVLTPTRVKLAVKPDPPHSLQQANTLVVLADPKYPPSMHFLTPALAEVTPQVSGIRFNPSTLNTKISYRPVIKFAIDAEKACDRKYGWCISGWEQATQNSTLSGHSSGLIYNLDKLSFPKNPIDAATPYTGHIEIRAEKHGAVISNLQDATAIPVQVYPFLKITPIPNYYPIRNALNVTNHNKECSDFEFQLLGYLPHPSSPTYSVRAEAMVSKPYATRELHGAVIYLDGEPIKIHHHPSPTAPYAWTTGKTLSKSELLGQHSLCLHLGKPKIGAQEAPFIVDIDFTLVEYPYDQFKVVESFQLEVRVEAVSAWPWIILAILAALVLLALLWYTRNKPSLPQDLGYRLSPNNQTAAQATFQFLKEPASFAQILGLVVEKTITTSSHEVLAWVVPMKDADELYQLRLASGVTIETHEPAALGSTRKLVNVEILRQYRLHSDKYGDYILRMEYSD